MSLIFILDLKVIIDFIPNHTSNETTWFMESCKNNHTDNPYRDYYVWEDATIVENNYANWVTIFLTN